MKYHVDRFFAAVSVLVMHGPVKQRLIKAYEEQLESIATDELPVAAQESFAELHRMMHTVVPTNGEGRVCASVRKMSKAEADICAKHIADLYDEIAHHGDQSEQPSAPVPIKGRKQPRIRAAAS